MRSCPYRPDWRLEICFDFTLLRAITGFRLDVYRRQF